MCCSRGRIYPSPGGKGSHLRVGPLAWIVLSLRRNDPDQVQRVFAAPARMGSANSQLLDRSSPRNSSNVDPPAAVSTRSAGPALSARSALFAQAGGTTRQTASVNAVKVGRSRAPGGDPIDHVRGALPDHREHDDLGAHVNTIVEVNHVFVDNTDAARKHMLAYRGRRVGSVNAINRAAEIHRACTQRIARPSGHEARQIRLADDHFPGRGTVRPLRPAFNRLGPRPGESPPADADAIANGLATAEHKIEVGAGRIDNNGARGLTGPVVDSPGGKIRW